MMKRTKRVLIALAFIVLMMNIIPVVTAEEEEEEDELLSTGMGMDWFRTQPQEFKDMIYWILGGLMFALGLVFIATSGIAAGKGMLDKSGFGNPEEKSKANNALFGILFMLIGVMIFIAIGTGVFSFF